MTIENGKTVPCLDCQHPMVPSGHRPRKGILIHRSRGLCFVCYDYHYRHGTLDRYPPVKRLIFSPDKCKRGVLTCPMCEDVMDLAEGGTPVYEWAERLDKTNVNLARLLYRHGKIRYARQVERLVREEKRQAVA